MSRHLQAESLPQIGRLWALVGGGYSAMAHPIVAQLQQPHNLLFDIHIDQLFAGIRKRQEPVLVQMA